MKKRIIAIIMTLILAMGLLAGCGNQGEETSSQPPEQKEDGKGTGYKAETVSIQGGQDRGGPNPFTHSIQGDGWLRCDLIFDSLLQPGEKEYIPWLAESWTLADDNVTFTFTLHDDVLWHDGEKVTTEDVAFSIDYYRQFPDAKTTLGAVDKFLIDSYEIVDEKTISIIAAKPDYSNVGGIGGFRIIPKHIWENVKDPYTYTEQDAYIGCGMYKFGSYDGANGTYVFDAFEDYYGFQPGAKCVQYVPVSDSLLAFENGDIDITALPADLYDSYASKNDISICKMNDFIGYKLIINYDAMPVFNDYEVRAAFYKALDREAMVESIYRGQGHVASAGHVPQSTTVYEPSVTTYDFDPEYAKSVLEPLNISFTLAVGNDASGESIALADMIKMNLADVGVTVDVAMYDTLVKNEMCVKGEYDLALSCHGGWDMEPHFVCRSCSDTYSKSPIFGSLMSSHGYSNPELTAEIDGALATLDHDERIKAFKKVQIGISNDIQILPLITQISNYIYRADYYDGWQGSFKASNPMINRMSFTCQAES